MVVGPDSVAHERKVEVGVRQSDQVQITNGVKPGEQVITFGALGLEDKAKVVVQKSTDAEAPDSAPNAGNEKP
jgi:HlyD family secretion protein